MSARDRQVARETVGHPKDCPHCNPGATRGVSTYTYRFTTTAEVVVTVDTRYGPDRVDLMEWDEREEWAYDEAVKRGKERTDEVAVSSHGVAIHLDIDGIDGEKVGD